MPYKCSYVVNGVSCMDFLTNLKQYSLLILGIGYLFLFFGSIYGLFVKEISLGFGPLSGSKKNLLCGFGLLLAFIIGSYPLLSGLYKALSGTSN